MTIPTDADGDLKAPEGAPPLPTEPLLDAADPKTKLLTRLRTVLLGLPAFFAFDNDISGVNATDLFSLNTLLGASIEGQVVKALNGQRRQWDPEGEWGGYVFERQSQAFPDVRLVRKASGGVADIALGIELKGWFLLSKEGEPSFRFTTTPAACADHDLLVVVPWYLDNVLGGSPVAAEPYVASSRWAAEYRNYYWQYMRRTKDGVDKSIMPPSPSATPYPKKESRTADVPGYDGGSNFGRVARVNGLMTEWIAATNQLEVLGIRIRDWGAFLRVHSDAADADSVSVALQKTMRTKLKGDAADRAVRIAELVQKLAQEVTGVALDG
jgi:hypothetical protein